MKLNETKYPNNSRLVAGTPQLFNDDVVLLCDTSSAPVVLNLLEIPADYWNTTWRLYIKDISSNASVNNITINAGVGQSINGASSVVLNVNDSEAFVIISSNTSFLADTSFCCGSGGSGGSKLIALTNAELTILINTGTVIANQWYIVTDAIFTSNYFANEERVPIVVQGITTNSISLGGSGIFLNADYQQIGNYSAIPGFVANIGVWTSALIPVANNVVMWNNSHWLNLTGVNTVNPPNLDVVNWVVLTKSTTTGYINEVDQITFNQQLNTIISREDKRLNYVENNIDETVIRFQSFNVFQWGNNEVNTNRVVGDSVFSIENNVLIGNLTSLGSIYANCLSGRSQIIFGQGDLKGFNQGLFFRNDSTEDSRVEFFTNQGSIYNNRFEKTNRMGFFIEILTETHSNTFINNTALVTLQTGCFFFDNALSYNTAFNVTSRSAFSKNRIDNCLVTITQNDGLFTQNIFEYSTITVGTNFIAGHIMKNTICNSVFSVQNNDNVVSQNIVNKGSSLILGTVNALISENEILSESLVDITTVLQEFGKTTKSGGNILMSNSSIVVNLMTKRIAGNTLKNKSNIVIGIENNGEISSNELNSTNITIDQNNSLIGSLLCHITDLTLATLSQDLSTGTAMDGNGNIKYEIDCADPLVYDLGTTTLFIDVNYVNFFGSYILTNAAGLTITKVNAPSTRWITEFSNDAGTTTFVSVAIGASAPYDMIDTMGGINYPLVFRAIPNAKDTLYLKTVGTDRVSVEKENIYL